MPGTKEEQEEEKRNRKRIDHSLVRKEVRCTSVSRLKFIERYWRLASFEMHSGKMSRLLFAKCRSTTASKIPSCSGTTLDSPCECRSRDTLEGDRDIENIQINLAWT